MKKLSIINKFGYAAGDLANGLTFGMSATFLLAFYTDVLGITAAAAGTLFLVARFWDALNDPLMGALADRMFSRPRRSGKERSEKFRPYLTKGSWPVVVTGILMFSIPGEMSMAGRLIWAYATYIAWGMAYTFINIPYGSLAAVMTKNPVERSSLSVFRGLGSLLGNMILRIAVPLFLIAFSDNQARGYLLAMILFGIIALGSYLFCYLNVEENLKGPAEDMKPFSLWESLSVIVKNRPFLAVSLASVAMLTGLLIQGSMQIYYFRENLKALELMGVTALLQVLPMIMAMPLIPKLVKRVGTKKTVVWSSLSSAVIMSVLLIFPDNIWIYLSGMFLALFGLMIPNILVWGMVSDCIDYNQYLSGLRQEGAIYGMYSFVRKVGQALAGFLAGIGLTLIGYAAGDPEQSLSTLRGIKFLSIGVPALGMAIAFLAYAFVWNLTPEKQKLVNQAIEKEEASHE